MLKRRGKNFQQIYRNPLPITLPIDTYGQLTLVSVFNPLSWLLLAWRLLRIYSQYPNVDLRVLVNVTRDESEEIVFAVSDDNGMKRLWQLGFFGKGTLSRSEPSWKERIEQRLGLVDSIDNMTREDVTSTRRDERKVFKSWRQEVQKYEELARLRSLSNTEQDAYTKATANLEAIKLKRESANNAASNPESSNIVQSLRPEDLELIDGDTNTLKANIETLQLQKIEVLFLVFALDAVQVKEGQTNFLLEDLFYTCLGPSKVPDNKFLLDYVVYHHYRSLGWCVRSGIKFGCDMLLYKRGPPMLHAEYSILVIPDGTCGWVEWQDFMALARVIGGVRKTLVLVFVECPKQSDFDEILLAKINKQSLKDLLKLYKVTEVIYKRWSPSRTRD